MDGRAALLVAAAAAAVSGAVVWLVSTRDVASSLAMSAQPEPGRAAQDERVDAILDRLDQIELRLSALEADRGGDAAREPAIDTGEAVTSAALAAEEREFIQRHREEFRALIDETRMERDWKERAGALGSWTNDFEHSLNLEEGAIKEFLVREYAPLFEVQWRWRNSPDYSASVDPQELTEARRSFRAALHAAYPEKLAERLFFAFGWERFDVLRGASNEMIQQSLAEFR